MAKSTPSDDKQAKQLEKSVAFKRLASARVTKAIATLRGIGALSNRSAYVYDAQQVAKIMDALKGAVNAVNQQFDKPDAPSGGGFTL